MSTISIDIAAVKRLVALDRMIKELSEAMKPLSKERDEIERRLFEDMAAAGLQNIALDDVTVYRATTVRASVPKEKRAEALEVCEQMGLDDCITLQPQTLTARIKEMATAGEDGVFDENRIPTRLREVISLYEQHDVRVVKR